MVQVTVNGHSSNFVLFTVTPHILNLLPSKGAAGALVTIWGTTFGATQESSTVAFNGKPATTSSWTTTQIKATVPAGATTGPIVVTVDGNASNGVMFTVGPSISSNGITPTSGPVGTSVTIKGLNFGATQSSVNGSVTFNGKTAKITSWNSTQIKATVPTGATTGPVIVTANGLQSNGETFTVN